MPKVKPHRSSPLIDMTAMTDVAFLLLTFFMLTAKMKPQEPVVVDTPSSISDTKLPDSDIMLITVDGEGKIYFSIDNQPRRKQLIEKLNTDHKIGLSEKEITSFALSGSMGIPFSGLKQYLSTPVAARSQIKSPGIPADSTSNELMYWIDQARRTTGGEKYRIVVKADKSSKYPAIRKVINTLTEGLELYKFNLITNLETDPNKIEGAK